VTLQDLIFKLSDYWAAQGCLVQQPLDIEIGAGTMHPETFLRVLGAQPWNVAYVQPSRRPADGRFGENPNRLFKHHQFQVILKPAPDDVQDMYLDSLRAIGIPIEQHDVRFVEDNWESPSLGAWGLGWEVWMDGMEITQFTYFQQAGGIELDPVSAEITYGLERLSMHLQNVRRAHDMEWSAGVTWAQVREAGERQFSAYNYELADTAMLARHFDDHEAEAGRCLEAGLPLVAYDHVLKCSHAFNLLDSRRAIAVTDRAAYILRMRRLTQAVAAAHLASAEGAGDA
jgi:glycyl-tRNA synthetase alpha chain